MTRWRELAARLAAAGVTGEPVEPVEAAAIDRAWLAAFCPRVKRATGHWIYGGYRWHAYSFEHEVAVVGDAARTAYAATTNREYYVLFEHAEVLARCSGPAHPSFDDGRDEAYVFPASLAWTMVYTHEQSMNLGPYFARPVR